MTNDPNRHAAPGPPPAESGLVALIAETRAQITRALTEPGIDPAAVLRSVDHQLAHLARLAAALDPDSPPPTG